MSSFQRHIVSALLEVLYDKSNAMIMLQTAQKHKDMRGLCSAIPNCIDSVEGMKQYCFRLLNPIAEMIILNRHHQEFCCSKIVWINVYEIIIRIDISLSDKLNERGIYNRSDAVIYAREYFSDFEAEIANSRFHGVGRYSILEFSRDVRRR